MMSKSGQVKQDWGVQSVKPQAQPNTVYSKDCQIVISTLFSGIFFYNS